MHCFGEDLYLMLESLRGLGHSLSTKDSKYTVLESVAMSSAERLQMVFKKSSFVAWLD